MSKRVFKEITLAELLSDSQLLSPEQDISRDNIFSALREKFDYEDDDLMYIQALYQGDSQPGIFGSNEYRDKIFNMYSAMSHDEMEALCT